MENLIFNVIALVLAVVATVLAFIFLVPEKRREKLNAFGKFLHDALNFKYLIVEKVLQALYIFATAFVILYGVLQLSTSSRATGAAAPHGWAAGACCSSFWGPSPCV